MLYGPVYVGNDRPGNHFLSRRPRGGRGFAFFAFGILEVCSLPSTGWFDGNGIFARFEVVESVNKFRVLRFRSRSRQLCKGGDEVGKGRVNRQV